MMAAPDLQHHHNHVHQHDLGVYYGPGVYARVSRYDPTRTLTLRRAFETKLLQRFRDLKRKIRRVVVDEDGFGLKLVVHSGQFDFPRSQLKVQSFMDWLQKQVDQGLLEVTHMPHAGISADVAWTDQYIEDSYKRGVIRAREEMQKAGYPVPSIADSGGVMASMSTPFHMDRLGLLYTRTFTGLKGITDVMDHQISQVLTQGIGDGDNPRLLAKKLLSTISGNKAGELGVTDTHGRFIPAERRARMLARTEIIRAHHQATIMEYRNWAVHGVKVKAEWVTAGFNVCPDCADLEGKTFTLNKIEGMIPLHPNCRCAALPVDVTKGKKGAKGISKPIPPKKTTGKQPLWKAAEEAAAVRKAAEEVADKAVEEAAIAKKAAEEAARKAAAAAEEVAAAKAAEKAAKKAAEEAAAKKAAEEAAAKKAAEEAAAVKKEVLGSLPDGFLEARAELTSDEVFKAIAERIGRGGEYPDADTFFKEVFGGREAAKEVLQSLLDKSSPYMAMKHTALSKLIKGDGVFKNSLETGKGTFKTVGAERAVKERRIFGITDDVAHPDAYPKYGFLAGDEGMDYERIVGWGYGDTFVRFDTDRVRDRLSITLGDSFDGNMFSGSTPLRITPPTAFTAPDEDFFLGMPHMGTPQATQELIKKLVGSKSISELGSWTSTYVEAQFYGRLTLDDVVEIEVSSIKQAKKLEKELKKAGYDHIKVVMARYDERVKALSSGYLQTTSARWYTSLRPSDVDRLGDDYIKSLQKIFFTTAKSWAKHRGVGELPEEIIPLVRRAMESGKDPSISEMRAWLKALYREFGKGTLPKSWQSDYKKSLLGWVDDVWDQSMFQAIRY